MGAFTLRLLAAGEGFHEVVNRPENRLTEQENEDLCAWGADRIASSLPFA